MRLRAVLWVLVMVASSLLACSLLGPTGTQEPLIVSPSETPEPSATSEPTPIPSHPPIIWMCYQCGGNEAWRLGPGEPTQITLPLSIGQYYSYSHVTDQIAYAQTFADHGAGPGNLAVSDLSLLNLTTGEVTTIYPDDVVEALWSPDGTRLAYILATATTYELRVREPDGSDRLLASDVSITWSFSPSGDAIAFTRESGYETPGTPGLYVVSVNSGTEVQVSDVDKSGTGSIDDRPSWTQDGQFVVLSHWAGPSAPRIVMARADGSASWDITLDESLATNWWYTPSISALLWYPDGERVLALPATSQEMGGPPPLVLFTYDRAAHILGGGTEIGTVNAIIDWDVPGETLWVVAAGGEVERISAP